MKNALRVRPRRHAGRRPGHPIVRALAYTAAAIVGFGGIGAYEYVQTAFDRVHTENIEPLLGDRPTVPEAPQDGSKGEPINILLLGSDTRTGANAAIGGANDGMRADTTILMHVSADRSRVEFVSIPRDSWVRISDCTLFDGTVVRGRTTKFNAAFANGARHGNVAEAVACTQKTFEDLSGLYVHYYAVVDFVGFEGMVNALGGVPMCVPGRIVSAEAGLNVYPGPQIFDGATAIAWARTRKVEVGKQFYNGTDIKRMAAQQVLMSHMVETVLSKNILWDANQIRDFVTAAADSLTVSPRLAQADYVIGLAWSLRHIDPNNIVFTTIPFKWTPDGNNVVWNDAGYAMLADLKNDRPIAGTSVVQASFATTVTAPAPSASLTPGQPTPAVEPSIDPLGACSV